MADPVTIGTAVGWGIKVSGWIISPIISRLFDKAFSYLGFRSSEKLKNLERKVLHLKLMFEAMDASPRSDRFDPWIKELRRAFYEAEDIIDAIDYQNLKKHIRSEAGDKSARLNLRGRTKQVVRIMTDFNVSIVSRIKLKTTLDTIESLIDEGHKLLSILNVPACSVNFNDTPYNTVRSRSTTTSAPPEVVFGRNQILTKIRAMLRDAPADAGPSSSRTKCYSVIGIFGIPGSGKTTLAQQVCEKERDDGFFELIMWIHVSQNFSVRTVFIEMLEIATDRKEDELRNLDMLQKKLESELKGKRFFLVLDDVWYSKGTHEQQLDLLLSPLKAGKRGSKILVTSRTADAAKALGAQDLFPIPDLDEEQYLSMFMHYALDGATINDQALRGELELIGRKIARKLGRSPLVARTVAGQLNRRLHIDFWRSTLNRDLLNGTMEALWWSYQQLEEHARQCFTFCSIFPRRYKLQRDELIHLWMAEGFVNTTNATEDVEDVSDDYFQELLSCSFIQQRQEANGKEYFTIHNLLHDLAERVAGSDCHTIEKVMVGRIPRSVQHLFIQSYDRSVFQEHILNLKNLRTLIMSDSTDKMTEEDFRRLLGCLKKLRVVHVNLGMLGTIPPCIGELKHLRYLGLSGSVFRNITLPPTFGKLYHLEKFSIPPIAQLHFSSNEGIANLVNLRYLRTYFGLNSPDIGKLTLLRTLPIFTVKRTRDFEIIQLEHLDNLRETLIIEGLRNVSSKEEAHQAKLANKEHLSFLILEWNTFPQSSSLILESPDNQKLVEEEILEALRPPSLIKSLKIRNYRGSRYPSWLSGERGKLESLHILGFSNCHGLDSPPRIIESFIYLRTLEISFCSWNSLPVNMHRLTLLEELIVHGCRYILSLPRLPWSLKKLILTCCNRSLVESCQMNGHPNWQKIVHVTEKTIR